MTVQMQAVSYDAIDPKAQARFWADVLGWRITVKTVKNRIHLDLRAEDQAAEVARIESLGGRRVSIGQSDDVTWIVMADPEGNEFCVLRAYTPEELASR